jgi:transcriptional regulator with PAS, ATPase and Fis domain
LIESDLFGHERGAFTGAHQRKLGKFELAQGGTLFLDEIGTLRPELQAKLLRVLQEREIERVGGTRPVKIDVRFIAATNTNIKEAVVSGAFREDLYYRLNVVPVVVPPLRERIQDVPLLVEHFIRRDNRRFHKRVEGLSPEALAALNAYRWPGNVRELENVIERCVVLAEGPIIQLNDLPLDVSLPQQATKVRRPRHSRSTRRRTSLSSRSCWCVLERVGWNLTEAGRILEIHRNSLRVKLARWGSARPGSAERPVLAPSNWARRTITGRSADEDRDDSHEICYRETGPWRRTVLVDRALAVELLSWNRGFSSGPYGRARQLSRRKARMASVDWNRRGGGCGVVPSWRR